MPAFLRAFFWTRLRVKGAPPKARASGGYNRYVRIISALLLSLCLAACNRGVENREAVRQSIADHLKGMPVNVELNSVQFNGNQATAEVTVIPKSAPEGKVSMSFKLEQQGGKWAVLGHGAGGSPHGGGAMPGGMPGDMPGGMPAMENPHGGGMPMPGGPAPSGGKMPSPENLPPAGVKK